MKMSAVVVALCGMVASAWIAQEWQATVTRQREERLDRVAAARTVTISSALRHYENALQAERSLWIASSTVIRSDFEEFAKTLDLEHRYPGLKGIGWRSFVSDRDADRFVARARKDGAPGFAIRPPGRRPNYYVTLYSEPATLFGSTWGFDARATPSILAALEEARDTGRTTMSDQTTLTTDLSLPKERRPVAFELFVPVYEKGAQPTNPTQRRAAFLGWASGQFRADDFLKAALQAAPPGTAVELHDEAVGNGGSLVATTFPPGMTATGPHLRTESFAFGGRKFVLRIAPLPGNPTLNERTIPAPAVLATGLAVSLLLGALLWLLAQVSTLYQRVGAMARTDGLTGVANRRAWDGELPRELDRAARSKLPLSVALIDMDRFKAYNDQHGHQAGDRLLKAAAAAWEGNLRKTDLLARYGGEEFAVLLPECGLDNATVIADRLLTAQPEGTCSIGLATWDFRESATELVARADRALYAAKEGGRNRYCADRAAGAESAAWVPTR
jgi:diguanylate cyclase (GGDEF)-like protein